MVTFTGYVAGMGINVTETKKGEFPYGSSTAILCFVWSLRRIRLVVCGHGRERVGVPPTLFDLIGGITPLPSFFQEGVTPSPYAGPSEGYPPPLPAVTGRASRMIRADATIPPRARSAAAPRQEAPAADR